MPILVKIAILVADILADPIIGTALMFIKCTYQYHTQPTYHVLQVRQWWGIAIVIHCWGTTSCCKSCTWKSAYWCLLQIPLQWGGSQIYPVL